MRRTYLVLLKQGEEANSTSASMKGACPPVGFMLVLPLLFLYLTLTTKMVDFIAKLKQFSKLDFQSKREMINNGRPMPELKGLLQTTGQKVTRSFQMEWYSRKDWLCGCATKKPPLLLSLSSL